MRSLTEIFEAAEEGDSLSQLLLADKLFFGEGITQNLYEAAAWYIKAASEGLAEAQNKIGYCYEKALGVQKDDVISASWYRRAAEQDNIEAQLNMALCYEQGRGVEKDDMAAARWRRRAAELGDAEAQYLLGMSYESGRGVPKDAGEARILFRRAAHRGYAQARNRLDRADRAALDGAGTTMFWEELVGWDKTSKEILSPGAEDHPLQWEDIAGPPEPRPEPDICVKNARTWNDLIREGDVKSGKIAEILKTGSFDEIVALFDVELTGEKIDAFWVERGKEAFRAALGAMVWLRDNQNLPLRHDTVRHFMAFENLQKLSRMQEIPASFAKPITEYLKRVPGYLAQDFNDEGRYVGNIVGGGDCAADFHRHAALPILNVLDKVER